MDIPMYEGNLDVEEHVVTRLKGHATLWWDELQVDRHCKGKK
jgi:hypothetical protein